MTKEEAVKKLMEYINVNKIRMDHPVTWEDLLMIVEIIDEVKGEK